MTIESKPFPLFYTPQTSKQTRQSHSIIIRCSICLMYKTIIMYGYQMVSDDRPYWASYIKHMRTDLYPILFEFLKRANMYRANYCLLQSCNGCSYLPIISWISHLIYMFEILYVSRRIYSMLSRYFVWMWVRRVS